MRGARGLLALLALPAGCTIPIVDVDCGEAWEELSAGGHHTLGRRSDGSLAAWGSDEKGQCAVPAGSFVTADAGYEFGCASGPDGTVCWGEDGAGQVSGAPEAALDVVAAGGEHACGLDADGALVCWGRDDVGQASDAPRGAFVGVAAGARHTCAVDAGGAVTCWGDPAAGEPPGGFVADPAVPLGAGFGATCALDAAGAATCWGALEGPPPDGPFVAITAGTGAACGVAGDGSLACWGLDDFGAATPPPGGDHAAVALGLGGYHGCAIARFADGRNTRAECWGLDASGQASPPPPPERR